MGITIYRLQIIMMTILSFAFIVSCSKPMQKPGQEDLPQKNDIEQTQDSDSSARIPFDEKYLREGFITNDEFRVVIVIASEDESTSDDEIKEKAKNRAFVTLQKFLRSNNRSVDKNTNAELLNLINTKGSFVRKGFEGYKDNVYYLEIKRENLILHLKKITER